MPFCTCQLVPGSPNLGFVSYEICSYLDQDLVLHMNNINAFPKVALAHVEAQEGLTGEVHSSHQGSG